MRLRATQDAPEVVLPFSRTGDAAEEDRLWGSVRPRLVRIALALGVPSGDVPDLVQDVLLAAHRALGRFDPAAGSFEAWVATILTRRARNLARARWRRRRLVEAVRRFGLPVAPRPAAAFDGLEARLVMERLLGCLTASQRDVVALYEIGEMDANETSRALGITPAGVRSIARDARRRLAEEARLLAGARTGDAAAAGTDAAGAKAARAEAAGAEGAGTGKGQS